MGYICRCSIKIFVGTLEFYHPPAEGFYFSEQSFFSFIPVSHSALPTLKVYTILRFLQVLERGYGVH